MALETTQLHSFIVDIVVQSSPWLKFYFPLFQTHYHQINRTKTKENQVLTKDKTAPKH